MMMKLLVLALSTTLCCAQITEFERATGANIQRDCDLKEYECIRKRVHRDKLCRIQHNTAEAPECYRMPETIYEQSYFNLTIVDTSTDICGLNRCYVSEFYRNKETGNKVLALTCYNTSITFERRGFQHRPLLEDEEVRFKVSAVFPEITLSTVLLKSCGWDMCTAHTATYFLPPSIQTYDQTGRDFVSTHIIPPDVFTRVILLGVGRNMFHKYVNTVICDFGCQ